MTNNNKCYCTDKICCQYCSTSGIEYDKPMTNIKKKKELIEESKNVHRLALKGALSEYQLYIWLNIKLKEQREDIIKEFLNGKRCIKCGKLAEVDGTNHCFKCFKLNNKQKYGERKHYTR